MKLTLQGKKSKLSSPEAGFSMLEVIIAILTITTFLLGTLQLMAVNALYKVRAERQARANFWIQEDVEDVKAVASTINANATPANPFVNANICTDVNNGYATALKRQLANVTAPNSIPTEQLIQTRQIVGKNYDLYRRFPDSTTVQANNPHRLRIEYRVELATNQVANDYRNQETIIANSSSEVIPDASFECR